MLSSGERPRELRWYHAGPMLFGDWGTSRLYVLGLAFAFNGRASLWFIGLMSVLLIGVGWSYEIICRLFPDGGGVYSSARHRSQLLAVIGGLLLCADYVVTASLSCLDAFHYLEAAFGFKGMSVLGLPIEAVMAAVAILAIGALNYLGPTKTGTIAMFIALATVALTLVIGVRAGLHIFHIMPVAGVGSVHVTTPNVTSWAGLKNSWIGFTEIVLALSGVEAIANMTGIMVQPVEKTARKAIVPVLVEIVILNLILAAAMNTLPDSILLTPEGKSAHTDDMLKVIASHYVGGAFATFSSVVFALLLLSAVNTALADLVSIQYMLSRDKELPHAFTGLNRFGMPVLPLLIAAVVPALVVLLFPDVTALSGLYAIGVVGAIGINLGTTSTNLGLALRRYERAMMFTFTVVMIAIEATICVEKPDARGFALIVLVAGLAARIGTIVTNPAAPIPRRGRIAYLAFAAACVAFEVGITLVIGRTWTGFGLSALVALVIGYASYQTQSYRAVVAAVEAPPVAPKRPLMMQPGAYTPRKRIMVATQGNPRLLEFALEECKSRQAELMVLFVRHLAVTPMGEIAGFKLNEDVQALELFDRLRVQAKEAGIPIRLLYGVARDIPDAILDMAVTHGADLLLLGTTRRGTLWRAMKGDVIQTVAEQLPESVGLLIHA